MICAAILGLGRWGRSLVTSVQGKSDDIRFVAAHTPTRARAEEFCAAQGLRFCDSYDAILRDPEIDAVVIATPHSQHLDQVRRAAAAGKHVFVEKPLALDHGDALRAVEAADRAGVVLAVGFVRRFHPSVCDVRARLKDGRLGTICGIVGQQTSGTGPFLPAGGWRADPAESPAAAMTAIGVHLLDHMIEFAGRIGEVECRVARRGAAPVDDTTSVLLAFESGASGLLFCCLSTGPYYNLSVYGTGGHAEVSESTLENFRFTPIPDAAPTGPVKAPPPEIVRRPGFDMLRAELEDFARAIVERRPFLVPIADVLHGAEVFDAIVRSAQTGAPVRLKGPA
ncbi:Gfo/Idh/MocA family protein [Aquabacter spiritensis]|uniref:Putative dehydrogenase n=1 Tax=Aquabacter spiritensis TaxID=933073 RepID=A0A4R3LZ89_9HYPH|nr:Gfo/Idh/MocA family oxidoreductase [Aquabacter spiritensis]TCT06064.1 putative dehydrogenase [Aquabacter spiritensis]